MHKFYLTNNLGGGGTNVSRLYDYIEKFQLDNIGILLNYYYLTGKSTPVFDKELLNYLGKNTDIHINDFLKYCHLTFKTNRESSDKFISESNFDKINGFLLDNGCGNILRDLLANGSNHQEISNIIEPFLEFAECHKFDYCVAPDLAMKYTYKAGEIYDPNFQKWNKIAADNNNNLDLLKTAISIIDQKKYSQRILAPIHGYDYSSFAKYTENIISLELEYNTHFYGFALGGIADTRKLDSTLWNIPKGFSKYKKSAYLCYNLINTIKNISDRYIHVLGAGNIYILPFIIKAGANSSDCHSAWRRSSDGGIDKAKILIPLMDKDFNFINNHNCLEYMKIGEINDKDYTLNCGYSIKEIQQLINSKGTDYYFGEIIIFLEAILQYNILIDFINKHPNDYLYLLTNTTDHALNEAYSQIITSLNI